MPLCKPLLRIQGRRATELYIEHGTFEAAVQAYNAEFNTSHDNRNFQTALKRWMAKNPVEARELYNRDCLKYNIPVPDDSEWDTIIRRIARSALGARGFPKWEAWYATL